jgi:pSer/pThr/pTyr-binding forkhead associated (FHA) protein
LRLVLLPGGLTVELTRPDMVIGRHSEADVRLALPDVSRRHCRFIFQHGHWKVIDLNSLNGVFVNGERMHEAVVYDGDHVRLGGFTFAVNLEAQPRIMPAPNSIGVKQIADVLSAAKEIEQRKAS